MPEKIKFEVEKKSFLDNWIEKEFNEQYDSQVRILHDLRLLEIFPGKDVMGIIGIDGKEYPVPTKEDIICEIKSNPEKYETKMKQGFTQIQLTPFAVPMERLTMTLGRALVDHYKRKKLFATKEKPTDPDEPLELNTNEPVNNHDWINAEAPEGERGADVSNRCVYYVDYIDFLNSLYSGGHTKAEILKAQSGQFFSGWEIKLFESNLNIPREGKGQTIGGRKQLEVNKTARQYLETIQIDPGYENERGLTNEDWLALFLVHLEKTNQVIDDIDGAGRACCLLGSLDRLSFYFGYGDWENQRQRVDLAQCHLASSDHYTGVRTAVAVGSELKFEK